jgi:hypothetical protein
LRTSWPLCAGTYILSIVITMLADLRVIPGPAIVLTLVHWYSLTIPVGLFYIS